MRRPVLALFFCTAGGILSAYYLPLAAAAVPLILALTAAFLKKKPVLALFLAVALCSAVYFELTETNITPLEKSCGTVAAVYGRVEGVQDKEGWLRIEIRAHDAERGRKRNRTSEKVLLQLYGSLSDIQNTSGAYLKNTQSLVGKDVYFKGEVSIPKQATNPGLFNYRLYLKSRGIHTIMETTSYHFIVYGKGNRLAAALAEMKQHFSDRLSEEMDEESKALLIGMLFGDKTALDEDLTEDFRRNGTTHVLAVSGIHVTVIFMCINRLFRNRRTRFSSITAISVLLLYAALSSFSPSVVRAVVMILICLFARHLYRRYDLLCSAAFSAFLFLLYNPYSLFNAGFQLSYLAVFTMAFLLPFSAEKLELLSGYRRYRRLYLVLKVFVPVFTIQIGMIPVTAYMFQYISFSAFIMNIPIIALSDVIITVGILLFILSFTGGILFPFAATGTDLLLKLTALLSRSTGSLEYSAINVIAPSVAFLILFYGIGYFCVSEMFWDWVRRRRRKSIAVVLISIICLASVSPWLTGETERRASVTFVDVGQGDCIHIRTPQGKNILIDGGGSADYDVGKKILLPYLLKNGVSHIDLACVTHLHQDHFGGLMSLCHLMPVRKLALYEGNRSGQQKILDEAGLSAKELLYLKKGDSISVEKGIRIDILYPETAPGDGVGTRETAEADENAATLVIRVEYQGVGILLTGDLGFSGEESMEEFYRGDADSPARADILKIGHHGSKYSTGEAFLDLVDPAVAVISVGQNNFGHPSADVIEKLRKKDIMVERTDLCGAVLVDVKDKKIRVRTML